MNSLRFSLLLLALLAFATGCASQPKPVTIPIDLEGNQDSGSPPEEKTLTGRIEVATGEVQIKSAQTGTLSPARVGQEINLKDTIVTSAQSATKVVMIDKNELDIAAGSQLKIENYESNPKGKKMALLNLLNGQVRAKVKQKYDGKDNQFHIKTPTAVAGVRGTDFLAAYDAVNSKSEVVTFDGAVEFGQPSAIGTIINSVSVKAGESSEAIAGQTPTTPVVVAKERLAQLDAQSEVVAQTPKVETPTPAPIVSAPPPTPAVTAPPPTATPPNHKHEPEKGVDPKVSLGWLEHGNDRYLKRNLRSDGQSKKDIQRLTKGQHPHAIILSCSDSRVPPEIVFDQKLGEIFVVRTAGEALDENVIASIEYAVTHLGARLLVVMGHTSCGAVSAAISTLGGKDAGSPALNHLVQDIQPRIKAMVSRDGATADLAKESLVNARGVAANLQEQSDIIREAVEKGDLVIQPALYNLSTGKVTFD